MKRYKVIGECEVADVAPGEIVTQEQLDAARAQVGFLLGIHLEELPEDEDTPTEDVPTAAAGRARKPR